MRKIVWRGTKDYLSPKEEVAISFDPSTGFVERDGKLFVVVDLDPESFQTGKLPSMLGVKVFAGDKHDFLQSATDQEVFGSEAILEIESYKPLRPAANTITVAPLEAGKEYCFVIYAEYPDR